MKSFLVDTATGTFGNVGFSGAVLENPGVLHNLLEGNPLIRLDYKKLEKILVPLQSGWLR